MRQILVFDVETTGLDYKEDQIIEFGGLLLDENWNVKGEISEFIKYHAPLPPKITEITGITNEMLLDGIEEAELAHKLNDLITDETFLIAYNIQFDIGFFIKLLEKYNFKFRNNSVLDAMVVYKDRHPYPHRLFNAIETYELNDVVNSHRAFDDAKATLSLILKMNEEKPVEEFINKISFHSKYGLNGIRLPYVEYYPYVYK